jgi:Zn-dependent protease with chaperone function
MRFARRLLFVSSFIFLLAVVAPRLSTPHAHAQQTAAPPRRIPDQSAPNQPVPSQAASNQVQPSPAQAYTLPPDKLAKAIAISRIRHTLELAGSVWGLVVLWLLLATRAAAGLAAWAERQVSRRWISGLLFFAVLLVVLTLTGLPFDMFGHHVERSYGVSVQGWGSWFGDQSKALGLTLLFGAPVMLLFNWIVRRWPRRYWLGIWLATLPLMVLGIFVSPLIEPLFNKYEPLAKTNPALVAELEKVVARTGTNIPPERMFLMKASLKSNGLNAYVSGMGTTKRIVVWDTTAGRIPDDEVLFIFGHESGHYVLNHIPKQLAGSAVFLFFLYWACAVVAAWLARRLGPRWGVESLASRAGFVVLLFTVSVASFILQPIGNAFSRHFEHEADVYGQEAIHGIVPDPQRTAVSGFNHLGEAWLEDPTPSPFIEFWLYNHPSVQNRANFAAHYDPWSNGAHPRFFNK